MKYIFIVMVVLFIGCTTVNKTKTMNQELKHSQGYKSLKKFNYDTTAYIRENFDKMGLKYVGKNMDFFLNDLEVPIINISYTSHRIDVIQFIDIYLYNSSLSFYNGQKIQMRITLANPPNKKEFIEKRKGSPPITWSEKDYELIKEFGIAGIDVIGIK